MNIIKVQDQVDFFKNKANELFKAFSNDKKPFFYFNSFIDHQCFSWVLEDDNKYVAVCNVLYLKNEKTWFIKDLYSLNSNNDEIYFKKLLNHIILFNIKTKRELNTICYQSNKINAFHYLPFPLKYDVVKINHYSIPYFLYNELKLKIDELLTFEIINNPICEKKDDNYYLKMINYNQDIENFINLYIENNDSLIHFSTDEYSLLNKQLEYYNIKPVEFFSLNVFGDFKNTNSITVDYFIK